MSQDIFRLNLAEQIFLHQYQSEFDEENFFNSIHPSMFEMIIKVANVDSTFETVCLKSQYDELWYNILAGCLLPELKGSQNESSYYTLDGIVPGFNVLRGFYYYWKALQIQGESSPGNLTEIECLKKAMSYHSIHAMRLYHKYLYQQAKEFPDEAAELLREIINNCRSMQEFYGSYVYMMEAEAYVQYSILVGEARHDPSLVEKSLKAALKCCDFAERYLDKSRNAIINASLGSGLGSSNSLGISSPELARELISEKLFGVETHEVETSRNVLKRGPS